MDGVQILNQTEIMKTNDNTSIALIIATAIFVIFLIIGLRKDFNFEIIVAGILLSIIAVFIIKTLTEKEVPTGKYSYKVIISDEVKFNEFNKKYEIIGQEGNIYTVILKDEEPK